MNDSAGEYLANPELKQASQPEPDAAKDNAPLRPGQFDPLAGAYAPLVVPATTSGVNLILPDTGNKPRKPLIEFYSPSQLKNYLIPAGQNLVGDYHIQKGAPAVLAGPPGCGKSRATLDLGVKGALGSGTWFGMQIHCKFKTLIVQSENGLTRLHRDFVQIPNLDGLDDWLRISAFPSYRGFEFANPQFRADLKAALREFGPQLVIVDPWNACVRDSWKRIFWKDSSDCGRSWRKCQTRLA